MQQILTSDADRAVMAVKGISAAGYALLVGLCPESHAPQRKRMPSRMARVSGYCRITCGVAHGRPAERATARKARSTSFAVSFDHICSPSRLQRRKCTNRLLGSGTGGQRFFVSRCPLVGDKRYPARDRLAFAFCRFQCGPTTNSRAHSGAKRHQDNSELSLLRKRHPQ